MPPRLAGVSVAAPYRHFKDKEALLAEIAAEGFVLFRDALARAAQSHPKDKVKRLVEMGVAYVDFALEHRSHFKVMWEGGNSKDNIRRLERPDTRLFAIRESGAGPAARAHRQDANRPWLRLRGAWFMATPA